MDFASTQSEILAFLEQAQEENLRHDQKTMGSIAAFRVEKGNFIGLDHEHVADFPPVREF